MRRKLSTLTIATLSVVLSGTNVFAAANNPYGIDYNGGAALGADNVQINPELVERLTPLIIDDTTSTLKYSNSSQWKEGYFSFGNSSKPSCDKVKFFTVPQNSQSNPFSDIWYEVSNTKYTSRVNIDNVYLDGLTSSASADKEYAVAITTTDTDIHGIGWLTVGWTAYSDNTCQTPVQKSTTLELTDGIHAYVKTNIKLLNNTTNAPFTSDELYFGITDVDQAQSYKILNQNNLLTPTNMFAKSAPDLQPDPSTTPLKNMFVSNGNYIYSQYDTDQNPKTVNAPVHQSDIFVKTNTDVQEKGLDLVYGFAYTAGSGIQYYAKQYTVNYDSNDEGEITGISTEKIISGKNPTGSTATPNPNYEFSHWVADTDVTLEDGTIIKAGNIITPEQITKVVVDKDITFTAIYKANAPFNAPDTGTSTSETNATFISVSLIGITLGALIVRLMPKILRKKVKFD